MAFINYCFVFFFSIFSIESLFTESFFIWTLLLFGMPSDNSTYSKIQILVASTVTSEFFLNLWFNICQCNRPYYSVRYSYCGRSLNSYWKFAWHVHNGQPIFGGISLLIIFCIFQDGIWRFLEATNLSKFMNRTKKLGTHFQNWWKNWSQDQIF